MLDFAIGADIYTNAILRRLRITDVSVVPQAVKRTETVVVCEIDVGEDMTNFAGSLNGGCAAWLLDSYVLSACILQLHRRGWSDVG